LSGISNLIKIPFLWCEPWLLQLLYAYDLNKLCSCVIIWCAKNKNNQFFLLDALPKMFRTPVTNASEQLALAQHSGLKMALPLSLPTSPQQHATGETSVQPRLLHAFSSQLPLVQHSSSSPTNSFRTTQPSGNATSLRQIR